MTNNSGLSGNAIVAFAGTTSAERAKEFFGGKLGLRLQSEELPFALVYDAAGTMLRVTMVKEVTPAPYTVLGWRVDDIETKVKELQARGVVFEKYPWMPQDDLAIWTSPSGARVAWFKDPDGNTLSLSYHP